jgi:lauroyl/myristoyl acyltransferase
VARDWVNRQLFRAAGGVAPHLSTAAVRRLGALAAVPVTLANGPHMQTYRHNLGRILGHPVDDATVRAGVASWLRTYLEVLALPNWSADDIRDRVATTGERHLRAAYAGPGVVVALPHLGNWDLAGAWATLSGYPVTTVAENLGAAEFAAYTALRGRLGMEVLRHDDPAVLGTLIAAVRRGRVVCLVSDRDLLGSGVPVDFAGHPVTMPSGPALIARRTGATLIAAAGRYTDDGMVLDISAPIPTRPGRAGLIAMTQEVADFFVAAIRRAPADWHLFQPFFDPSFFGQSFFDQSRADR